MSRKTSSILLIALMTLAGSALRTASGGENPAQETAPALAPLAPMAPLDLPDIQVVDQDGKPRRFVTDLIRGRTVAVSFVFTTCTTVCPPIGATFGRLRQLLGERAGRDLHLVSVSIDPANDTPARLKAWAQKFGAGPGWTLVTGDRDEITRLLKAFGSYSADRNAHVPLLAVGDAQGRWTFVSGLTPAAKLAELLGRVAAAAPPAAAPAKNSAAQKYFGDTLLVDQDGREVRFYSDLLRGKAVVMDFIFTRCSGVCPVLSSTFARIQDHLGDRLGKDVFLLSFSVDPAYDTPARLKEYAARFGARPGWRFLTGPPENVQTVLGRLGQNVDAPDQHQNIFLLGNDRTGLWKKAFGPAPPDELFTIVDSVVEDR